MGKKNPQNQQNKKIPVIANGGIQKRSHANNANLKIIVPPSPYSIAGLPFAARPVWRAGPSTQPVPPPVSSTKFLPHPSSLPNFVLPVPPLPPRPKLQPHPKPLPPPPTIQSCPPPSTAPSVVILPPFNTSGLAQLQAQYKSPTKRRRQQQKKATVIVQSHPKALVPLGDESEVEQTKNAQLKYAKLLASRSKKSSIGAPPEVKPDPEAPVFNLFMNIAQRYRSVQKEPEAIEVVDTEEDEDNDELDEVEEVTEDENAAAVASSLATVIDVTDSGNVTMFGDL